MLCFLRSIIRRLSLQAIETGSVTAIYATICIIVYETYSETNVGSFSASIFCLPRTVRRLTRAFLLGKQLSPMLGMMMGRIYG